jgi:predicted dehydrogenase
MTASRKVALVIGYGSIGRRHAKVLREMGLSVKISSRRPVEEFDNSSIETMIANYPDCYAVVATETSRHAQDLWTLYEAGHTGPLLVEKPLTAGPEDSLPTFRHVAAVGFDLRFHPLLLKFRERLRDHTIYTVEAAVGQYLPDWRTDRDFHEGYSAKSELGGGVIRDLSHEIDYLMWLFGPWRRLASLTGNTGLLEIDSEEYAHVLIHGEKVPALSLTMDYLDRPYRRYCRVQHDGGTTLLDFAAEHIIENGKIVDRISVPVDKIYTDLHRNVLATVETQTIETQFCNFKQARSVQIAIAAIETASEEERWVVL